MTDTAKMQQKEIETLKKNKADYDRQQMENEVEKARREKARLDKERLRQLDGKQ